MIWLISHYVKRFSSKEENGIKINVLWKDKYLYSKMGIENHVNYAKCDNEELLIATYILLKSRIYNRYFKIINGTTQVNVSDLNSLPVPPLDDLKIISAGINKEKISDITGKECDEIVNDYIRNVASLEN